MSAIPPDIVGAAAQAGFAAPEASRVRDADRSAQANAAARQQRAVTDAADSVETSDGDTAVFADAEGAGSQGRAFEESQTAEPDAEAQAVSEGEYEIDTPRLDIEA